MDTTLEVLDVKERDHSDATPPTFPTPPAPSTTGFPAHKKRVSAFKQQRQRKPSAVSPGSTNSSSQDAGPAAKPSSVKDAAPLGKAEFDERRGIDEENRAVLESMSPEEIAEAQRELYNGLDPNFIQMLLKRANLDEPTGPSPFDVAQTEPRPDADRRGASRPPRQASVEDAPEDRSEAGASPARTEGRGEKKAKKTVKFDEDAAPPAPPPGLFPAASTRHPRPDVPESQPHSGSNSNSDSSDHPLPDGGPGPGPGPHNTHFPRPPAVPDLDPSDPDFLETMHKKYFPNLPADPSKLAWMAPVPTPDSAADRESPYYPGQDSLPVSALRFDFRGALLPPRLSRAIPVSKGLHHHGEAPEAAGYTIPELARLARSAVPAQRCLAYQTLGRMLYRLGRGDWGAGAGGRGGEEDDLAFALWRCFREGRVLESLEEEAALPEGKGHLSCKAYATEALWLFEKGGWRERWRGL